MDIKELRSFCMVAKFGSFSKASQALELGQPAVTKHVQRMEAELGHSLFERGMRPLRLTAAGSHLLRMAEPLVEGLDSLHSSTPLSSLAPIAVGVPHGMVANVLPEALRGLRADVPDARVRVHSGTKEEVYELVQVYGVDFAIAPDPGQSRSFDFVPLYTSERILVVPEGHPLCTRPLHTLEELARYPLILPRYQTETRALLETEFRRRRVPYDIALELDSVELLERYVELGVGLGVGMQGAMDPVHTGRTRILSLDAWLPSVDIGIITRRAVPLSESALALIERVQQVARSHAAAPLPPTVTPGPAPLVPPAAPRAASRRTEKKV
jgi:DNA-binding transcriptional LysR family regulator